MSTGFENANASDQQTDAFDLDLSGTSDASDLDVSREPVGPGTYHVGITDVELAPLDNKHQPVPNAFLKLSMEILTGEPANEAGKKFSHIFFRPDTSATGEERRWKFDEPRNLLARLGMATGAIPANSFGQKVQPQWPQMVGRHFVIRIYRKKPKEEGKLGYLAVGNIWHAASAEVTKFVDMDTVQQMPMGADPMATAANGNGGGSGQKVKSPAAAPSAQQAAAASAVESL